jgi:hypothetical protein
MKLVHVVTGVVVVTGSAVTGSFLGSEPEARYTRETTKFTVALHFDTQEHVLAICNGLKAWGPTPKAPVKGHSIGCNAFDTDTGVCDVYTPRPKFVNDDATLNLGHEVLHCYGGAYHE